MSPLNLENVKSQEIQVPSLEHYGEHRLYRDAQEKNRLCVDALTPRIRAPVDGLAPSTDTSGRPARPVCVALGPDVRALEAARARFGGYRSTAMSWSSGPFFAWSRKVGGVTVLDQGESSRTRGNEIHVRGVQPEGIELTRAVVAVELATWGRLCGVSLEASAAGGVADEVARAIRVGRHAIWGSTLGDVLLCALHDLLRRDRLRITVASAAEPLVACEEIRELVTMEWAHRLAGSRPLSLPAALLPGLTQERPVDLSIAWRDGDRVPVRVLRSLNYDSIAVDSVQSLSWGLRAGLAEPAAVPA